MSMEKVFVDVPDGEVVVVNSAELLAEVVTDCVRAVDLVAVSLPDFVPLGSAVLVCVNVSLAVAERVSDRSALDDRDAVMVRRLADMLVDLETSLVSEFGERVSSLLKVVDLVKLDVSDSVPDSSFVGDSSDCDIVADFWDDELLVCVMERSCERVMDFDGGDLVNVPSSEKVCDTLVV